MARATNMEYIAKLKAQLAEAEAKAEAKREAQRLALSEKLTTLQAKQVELDAAHAKRMAAANDTHNERMAKLDQQILEIEEKLANMAGDSTEQTDDDNFTSVDVDAV